MICGFFVSDEWSPRSFSTVCCAHRFGCTVAFQDDDEHIGRPLSKMTVAANHDGAPVKPGQAKLFTHAPSLLKEGWAPRNSWYMKVRTLSIPTFWPDLSVRYRTVDHSTPDLKVSEMTLSSRETCTSSGINCNISLVISNKTTTLNFQLSEAPKDLLCPFVKFPGTTSNRNRLNWPSICTYIKKWIEAKPN